MVILVAAIGFTSFFIISNNVKNRSNMAYLASDLTTLSLYNENKEVVKEVVRGSKVKVYINQTIDEEYIKINYENVEYYINKKNLVYKKEDIVQENEVYVRTSYNLNKDNESINLLGLVNKGDKLTVIGYDKLLDDGNVNMYKVETANQETGYFYQKYVVLDKESSLLNYDPDGIYKIHASKKDVYGGGDGASLDYYPVIKPSFEDNQMPSNVYSLYLNGTKAVISKVDDYIEYAKTTKINAFVVDIKDSGVTGYASPVIK